MENYLEYLKSDMATARFAFKGQLGEAAQAAEPVLLALEGVDTGALPRRIATSFRKQLVSEIEQLQAAGLRRILRITNPKFTSKKDKNSFGFTRWVDASREWRECQLTAAVLDRYVDLVSGETVMEYYDENATITLRQSRHIKASDRKKAKDGKTELYVRERYSCPSCGAELEHIADSTSCPYCGAVISFNFFDWQLDSFYIDLRKKSLTDTAKEIGAAAVVGTFNVLGFITELLAGSMERRAYVADRQGSRGYNYALSAGLTVFICVAVLVVLGFLAMPVYLRIALIALAALLIARAVYMLIKSSEQDRKKKKIVRYSDAYLRSCVYDELWKTIDTKSLVDFSVDDIILKSVKNTDTQTTVELCATLIKKYLSADKGLSIVAEEKPMTLRRARYPERKKSKGKMFEEKACPSCGANFEPDGNSCCSYCGYGLRMENYVWRRVR